MIAAFEKTRMLELSCLQPGCLSATMDAASDDDSVLLVMGRWQDGASYRCWLDNPARGRITTAISPFLEELPRAQMFEVLNERTAITSPSNLHPQQLSDR